MIAIATCLDIPEPDVDEDLLLDALKTAGMKAEMAAWDDPSVDWSAYRLCVIRSTWDYPERPAEFAMWLERVSRQTILLNDAATASWNIDKRYLLELESKGIRIVPTAWFERGSQLDALPWADVVIKPAVSAGSWLTERFTADQTRQASCFLQEQLKNRAMMAQPYLKSIEHGGEVAWVWIDGEVTHGVRKAARFHDGEECVSEAVDVDSEAQALVQRIMEMVSPDLLYARIDLMESDGEWLLSELELIEPSLFFKQNRWALERFIEAIRKRIA